MKTYIIEEKSDRNAIRQGMTIHAKTLTSAKRAATKAQVWQGTCLCVYDEAGNRLAWKHASSEKGAGWHDDAYYEQEEKD